MNTTRSIGPQRIVSLAPSATSILCALGARRHLVGVTKWCASVAPVGRLPRLGDCWSLDVSALAKLRPTMIIGSVPYKTEAVERVLEIGAPFLAMNPRSLADIYADIRLLGLLTDRRRSAEDVIRRMHAAFAKIKRRTEGLASRPRVYCEAWPNPRISSPPWVAELVEIAGGQSVLTAGAQVSDENVAAANPQVIVLAWTATGMRTQSRQALENPLWQEVEAIRDRRVHVVRDEWLNTPAPILVKGAEEVLRLVHPELCARSRPRMRGAGGVPVR